MRPEKTKGNQNSPFRGLGGFHASREVKRKMKIMTAKTKTYSIQGKAFSQQEFRWGACSACVLARHILTLFLLLTLFPSCGHDDIIMPDDNTVSTTPYIELRIAIPFANSTATRANPMGGEDGNGREQGISNEDNVHDINVFFYKGELGLNGSETTKIEHHMFFNIDNMLDEDNSPLLEGTEPVFDKHYLILKFSYAGKIAELGEGTNFAAVANIGNLEGANIKTLEDLRKLDVSNLSNTWSTTYDAYSKDASQMDYFLMSTAYNDNYRGSGSNKIEKGSEGNFTGTTTLERMYSRIDLWYNKKTNAGNVENAVELKYAIPDDDGKECANVYITNVLPVNVMKTPSFLFKKVTGNLNSWNLSKLKEQNSNSLINWAGRETLDENGCPANYVLEPHTTDKSTDGKTLETDLKKWYGNTAKSTVIEKIKRDNTDPDTDGHFASYFQMDRLPAGNDPDYGCDRIAIISYANENTHPVDCFHSNYLTGLAFRAIYVPKTVYKDEKLTPMSEDEMAENIFRYSPSVQEGQTEGKCVYFSTYKAASDYRNAHKEEVGIITQFDSCLKNGKLGFHCYYNLWLRHYSDTDDASKADPHKPLPMEYATVRNNIYRVSVSFSGPGDPEPTMREPETMQARIFVRKWNLRNENEDLQF